MIIRPGPFSMMADHRSNLDSCLHLPMLQEPTWWHTHSTGQTHQTYFNGEFSLIARCDFELIRKCHCTTFPHHFLSAGLHVNGAFCHRRNLQFLILHLLLFIVLPCGWCMHWILLAYISFLYINFSTVKGSPCADALS